jgi:hypothetical protein
VVRFENARADRSVGAAHLDPAEDAHLAELGKQRTIARQQQTDVGALRMQRMRQAVEHVAEAAGLHQRKGLARHEQYLHRSAFHCCFPFLLFRRFIRMA